MLRKTYDCVYYIFPLVMIGIPLEIYHYMLQKNPNIVTIFECTGAKPCDALQVNYFGFVTIPFLCLIAFVIIATLSYFVHRKIS